MKNLFTPSEIVLLHGDKFVHDENLSSNYTFLLDIKDLYYPDNEEIEEFIEYQFSTLPSLSVFKKNTKKIFEFIFLHRI